MNFHDFHGEFPPASGPIRPDAANDLSHEFPEAPDEKSQSPQPHAWSWRVHILPFCEQRSLYDQFRFDEPWDSEHNLSVAEAMPSYYQCPSDKPGFKIVNGHRVPVTNYVMVSGPNTVGSINGEPISFSDISDEMSDTLLIVEVTGENRPAWTEPVDISLEDFSRGINSESGMSIGSRHPNKVCVGLCDYSVRYIREDVELEQLRRMGQSNDGLPINWERWKIVPR